ncbi:MAG: tetratricopeptide repeat protein [Rubrivivax sp.]|nr:tetratricopeptide repeat protein [Rubrivivax sp.]
MMVAVGGCAQVQRADPAANLTQDRLFPSPDEAARVAAEASQVFAMSDGMREYAERVLRDPASWRDRRQALIDSLYMKGALQLAYDAEATRSAAGAFEARAGNCLSLVLMTAAFAKHLDVPVQYQQVLIDDEFSRAGDLFFVSSHVNVVLGRHGAPFKSDDAQWLTIDFLPQVDLRGQRTLPLDEPTLVAMYLNNRAAEALARGELNAAYWRAREALRRDPHFAAAANTLGVVYQRAGHLQAAERALRFVVEREPRSASGWANLARLFGSQGRHEEARLASQRLSALEPHPPFHFLELGRVALQQGHAAQARDLLLRELRLQPQQHEVHFWLAQAYAALGELRPADKHLGQAAEFSPTRQTRAIYAGKLERLRATHRQ